MYSDLSQLHFTRIQSVAARSVQLAFLYRIALIIVIIGMYRDFQNPCNTVLDLRTQ